MSAIILFKHNHLAMDRQQSFQECFRGVEAPVGVVGVSQPLAVSIKSALLLATVDSLWWSLDEARLCLLGQEAERGLQHC